MISFLFVEVISAEPYLGTREFWQLAWNLNQTTEKFNVFRGEAISVPQERRIPDLFETPQDALMHPVSMESESGVQRLVDFTKHSDYPQHPPRNGVLPGGLDRFVIRRGYKELYSRAEQLGTRYLNYRPGPGQTLPPKHNIVLSGTPGVGGPS